METIFVAIISTCGVIATTLIQSHQANKKDTIESKLTNIQISFEKQLKELNEFLNKETLDRSKNDLVSLMSRIRNGYTPTVEEKMILYETKQRYNDLGGDSYVDDMFESLKKEGKL